MWYSVRNVKKRIKNYETTDCLKSKNIKPITQNKHTNELAITKPNKKNSGKYQ